MMKKNRILILLASFSLAIFFASCNTKEEGATEQSEKTKIVELTETDKHSETLNEAEEIAENIENEEDANKNETVFEGEFVDASVLDMSYFYFFKDNSGKEMSFYYNPQESNLSTSIQFMGADLMVNKEMIGKKFRIKYSTIEKIDDYTGELTKFNIPTSIEKK